MAPRMKRSKSDNGRAFLYRRTDDESKKKTFLNRINFEKCLPFKKRMFPIEVQNKKTHFKPTPYEKPVTRSQGRRSVTPKLNNKENHVDSSNVEKVTQLLNYIQTNPMKRYDIRLNTLTSTIVDLLFLFYLICRIVNSVCVHFCNFQKTQARRKSIGRRLSQKTTTINNNIQVMKSDALSTETADNNIYALDYFEIDANDAFKLKYYLLS